MNFDNLKVPFENYTVVNPPNFDLISREDFGQKTRDYMISVLPHCDLHFKVENVNCLDENDKMRIKMLQLDENPYETYETEAYSPYSIGCGIFSDQTKLGVLSGRRAYKLEITRNGQVSYMYDTVLLKPNVMNNFYIEY
jgi:hypothetical protein